MTHNKIKLLTAETLFQVIDVNIKYLGIMRHNLPATLDLRQYQYHSQVLIVILAIWHLLFACTHYSHTLITQELLGSELCATLRAHATLHYSCTVHWKEMYLVRFWSL